MILPIKAIFVILINPAKNDVVVNLILDQKLSDKLI